jgi:hypothetical protein
VSCNEQRHDASIYLFILLRKSNSHRLEPFGRLTDENARDLVSTRSDCIISIREWQEREDMKKMAVTRCLVLPLAVAKTG